MSEKVMPYPFKPKYNADTGTLTLESTRKLTPEEQKIADKAVELIAKQYGITIKKLAEE